MAVLFDPTDEYVRSVLDRAKLEGEISLPNLEAIVEGGLQDKAEIEIDDIADTIDALAALGIEVADDLTQEQHDEEFYASMKAWVDEGNRLPSLTGEGFDRLARVVDRKNRGVPDPSPQEVVQRQKILAERNLGSEPVRRLWSLVTRTRDRGR